MLNRKLSYTTVNTDNYIQAIHFQSGTILITLLVEIPQRKKTRFNSFKINKNK